jgi:hypothetical protein
MLRSTACCLALGLCASVIFADEGKKVKRPISEAESVLAVYREDWGPTSNGEPAIILVAWPDGQVVWSGDRLNGGAPYHSGRIDPKRVTALLQRFDRGGLFADEKLNHAHFGPDSQFLTVFIKFGNAKVKMQSWHELFEASEKTVADHNGVSALEGHRRLDVLRKAPADYLFFRMVWSETRGKLADLVPSESSASVGKPVMKAGVLSWQDLGAAPQSKGDPSRK